MLSEIANFKNSTRIIAIALTLSYMAWDAVVYLCTVGVWRYLELIG